MNDYTHYRYLIQNEKTGEKRTAFAAKGQRPAVKPNEKIMSVLGGTNLTARGIREYCPEERSS